jgi:hypothetical protein
MYPIKPMVKYAIPEIKMLLFATDNTLLFVGSLNVCITGYIIGDAANPNDNTGNTIIIFSLFHVWTALFPANSCSAYKSGYTELLKKYTTATDKVNIHAIKIPNADVLLNAFADLIIVPSGTNPKHTTATIVSPRLGSAPAGTIVPATPEKISETIFTYATEQPINNATTHTLTNIFPLFPNVLNATSS